jgi:hypothetical protein
MGMLKKMVIAAFLLTTLLTIAVAAQLTMLDRQGGLVIGFVMIGPVLSLYRYVKRAVRGGETAVADGWGAIVGLGVVAAMYGALLTLLSSEQGSAMLITLPIAAYPGAAGGFMLGRLLGYLRQK